MTHLTAEQMDADVVITPGEPASSAWEADRRRLEDYDSSFRLYDDAMRRGTKMWQAAHPGNARVWPDAANLAAWLMAHIEALEKRLGDAAQALIQANLRERVADLDRIRLEEARAKEKKP